ncbi:MAG: sulfotransferase family 2 domain-containing protein [Pseudomonadota bacterium]
MRLSHQRKFIFLAYPRTASRTIRTFLNPISDVKGIAAQDVSPENPFYVHIDASNAGKALERAGHRWADYYSFAFVRHPYTRVQSLYRMYLSSYVGEEGSGRHVSDAFSWTDYIDRYIKVRPFREDAA